MSMSITLAPVDSGAQSRAAVAGFLAGYCGATRRGYGTDLRLFAIWCGEADLELLHVRRAHLELYGRWLEETGKMRARLLGGCPP